MGFLMHGAVIIPHRRLIRMVFVVVAASALLNGCSSTRLNVQVTPSEGDRVMYGKIPERSFFDSSRWTFPLRQTWEYDASAGFGPAPMIVVGSTMFVGTLRGELHALDLAAGKRSGYIKTFNPVFAAPAYFKKLLIICTESGKENLAAFDLQRNDFRWTRDLGGIVASPLILNDLLIVAGLNGHISAYDEYGTEIWTADLQSEIRSSPAASDTIVYCASTKGEIVALSAANGRLLWKTSANNALYAGLTVSGGRLFAASRDSSVYIINGRNGAVENRIVVGNKVMAAPAVSDGMMIITTLGGLVGAYSVPSGSPLWEFRSQNAVNTTPFMTPSAVFVASLDRNIYALDPGTGAVLWKQELPARVKTSPLVWKNSLYIASEDKNIYRFDSAK